MDKNKDKTDRAILGWAEGKNKLHLVKFVGGDIPSLICGPDIEKTIKQALKRKAPDDYFAYALVHEAEKDRFPDLVLRVSAPQGRQTREEMALEEFLASPNKLTPAGVIVPGTESTDERGEDRRRLLKRIHELTGTLTDLALGPTDQIILNPSRLGEGIYGKELCSLVLRNTTEPGKTSTLINEVPADSFKTEALQAVSALLGRIRGAVFTGKARIAGDGTAELRNEEKKKYNVTVYWRVSYSDTVEAYDEDEALEAVRQKALDSPSSDWEWREETDNYVSKEE